MTTNHSLHQLALDASSSRSSRDGLNQRALSRTLEYIGDHLGDHVTPQDLAQAIGLSRFHFARLFRKSTGESPMRYVQRCRIEHAKRLIGEGELLMTEIAVSVGFYDQSHFSRWFRKLVGMTPRQFATASSQTFMEVRSSSAPAITSLR